MRYVRYREGPGRAGSTARGNLNELLMLTEAAVSLTNIQRWSQARVTEMALRGSRDAALTSIIPESLKGRSKKNQYETEVVYTFLQLAAQSFAFHGSESLWERPIRTGRRGRPESIDVSLFNSAKREESRIEFGIYSTSKLREDAGKLCRIQQAGTDSIPETILTNYVILWDSRQGRASKKGADEWFRTCNSSALENAPDDVVLLVRAASMQDLFSPTGGRGSHLCAAIFQASVDLVDEEGSTA